MYTFRFNNIEKTNQYEELIKIFLQPSEFEIIRDEEKAADYTYEMVTDKDELKRNLYNDLSKITGKSPKWGILTGIRPVKLAGELHDNNIDIKKVMKDNYLLHDSKIDLVSNTLDFQRKVAGKPLRDSMSIYLGIPFCPTRCLYCSFTSNQVGEDEIKRYLEALHHEIRICGEMAKAEGQIIESVYFGGGTPTTISAQQMDELLREMNDSFDLSKIREFTVEAGRPDTITSEKLNVLRDHGVDRISINPQTMKQETLDIIGRSHTVKDVYEAFETADKCRIETINTDLIAGLPGEDENDFMHSLSEIIRLGAENITVHTLAVKRASRLKEMDELFNYREEELREEMLRLGHKAMAENGFVPYYLYRQKHTSGNTENTGFCLNNKASIYNIRIMEEAQSILALGAGGISKIYFPDENRLERVPNVSNYEIYIERIQEMIERKEKGFFVKNK
ncbi:MAG: coproporphyrinogen dehydrogenase HemZ [Firmicutes bacterium]|nr:coproporphyrinogen dehydrogenase HemZ [Bacillota bacterium]